MEAVEQNLPKRPKFLYPPIYLLLALILMIVLDQIAPWVNLIASPLRYLGIVLMGVGLGPALWVNAKFKRAGTTIKPFEESSTLVVEGPFRLSRNPIYLGMVIFLLGLAILLGSLTPFLVVTAFAILIDRRFIRVEEAMLSRTFGAPYDDYRRRVRRWL